MGVPVLLSMALVSWSFVANLVIGDTLYTLRNLVLTILLLGALRWLVPTRSLPSVPAEVGLSRSRLSSGLRWGAGAVAIIAAVITAGVALDVLPGVGFLLADGRADVPADQLAQIALVRIPFGTALFEEIAFRGVLLGLLLRLMRPPWAVLWSSVVFGLWHIAPTLVTLQINDIAPGSAQGLGAITGSVVATTVAGALFCWLRLASRSLVAPICAHWATNSLGLAAAALVQRTSGPDVAVA